MFCYSKIQADFTHILSDYFTATGALRTNEEILRNIGKCLKGTHKTDR